MRILIALPDMDFDPTEVSAPWKTLRQAGVEVQFATPSGGAGRADPRVLTGKGFGILRTFFAARTDAVRLYSELETDACFRSPLRFEEVREHDFDGLILPGGHAPGMRPYLESTHLQAMVGECFERHRPIGAICHGVLIPARTVSPKTGRSILHGRKTTALLKSMELSAWTATVAWLGDYFRTYPTPVETEVRNALKAQEDFVSGPFGLRRDSFEHPEIGFAVVDENYVSARWPGDAHRFAREFLKTLQG